MFINGRRFCMTDGSSNGLLHFDSAALEMFLCEWGLKIQEPTPDEEAEIIASRLRLKEKRIADPTHQQVP
jgi:hypothetical protein